MSALARQTANRAPAALPGRPGTDQAIAQTPNLDAKTKGTMSWLMQNEFYQELGLNKLDLIDLPNPHIKPGTP